MEIFLEKFDEFNKRHKIHKMNADSLSELIKIKVFSFISINLFFIRLKQKIKISCFPKWFQLQYQ